MQENLSGTLLFSFWTSTPDLNKSFNISMIFKVYANAGRACTEVAMSEYRFAAGSENAGPHHLFRRNTPY